MSRAEIKRLAKQRFKEQWGTLLLVLLLSIPAEGIALFLGFGVGGIIVIGPLIFGIFYTFLKAAHGEKADWTDLFAGFRFRFGESFFVNIFPMIIGWVIAFVIGLVMMIIASLINRMASSFNDGMSYGTDIKISLFFIFLAVCIVIVLAIVIAIFYSLAFIILIKEPETGALEALKKSRMMIYGDKASLFIFFLSFIGWELLCIFTWLIPFVYVGPYMWMATTMYLEQIYEKKAGKPMEEDADFQKLMALKEKMRDKAESFRGERDEDVKSTVEVDADDAIAEEAFDTAGEETFDKSVEKLFTENYCIYCGAALPEGARFCGKCGKEQ